MTYPGSLPRLMERLTGYLEPIALIEPSTHICFKLMN
jgi:hypothetical protein